MEPVEQCLEILSVTRLCAHLIVWLVAFQYVRYTGNHDELPMHRPTVFSGNQAKPLLSVEHSMRVGTYLRCCYGGGPEPTVSFCWKPKAGTVGNRLP